MSCGCRIVIAQVDRRIDYCSLHAAAERLAEALTEALEWLVGNPHYHCTYAKYPCGTGAVVRKEAERHRALLREIGRDVAGRS